MNQKAESATIELIFPIWQRVLKRHDIGVDEDFFDLGGDPALAYRLFNEIAEVSGRELPPVMICYAPTITALAALLNQAVAPSLSTLVRMKRGIDVAPLFIAPGGGGNVLNFFPLARHIRSPRSVYGLQATDPGGTDKPFGRIEERAQFYLDAIKHLQPHGPYFLAGYSSGGLVMLEVARRFYEEGEKTALLVMVDSYPYRRFLAPRQRLNLMATLVRNHIFTMARLPIREALAYLISRIQLKLGISKNVEAMTHNQPLVSPSLRPALQRLRDSDSLAWKNYRPRFYGGKINFVKAEISHGFPEDAAAVWSKLANEFEVETISGDHFRIITKNFEYLAAIISRHLDEISC